MLPSRGSPRTPSLPFRLRLAKSIVELEGACRFASDHSWNEADRARVEEIAGAFSDACRLEGLRESAVLARSLTCLMRLSRDQIVPIEGSYREKVAEVMASLRTMAEGARRMTRR